MSANTVTRGYVVAFRNGHRSAIVPKSRAESMAKRFGGRVVNVAGLAFRTVRGVRVLANSADVVTD